MTDNPLEDSREQPPHNPGPQGVPQQPYPPRSQQPYPQRPAQPQYPGSYPPPGYPPQGQPYGQPYGQQPAAPYPYPQMQPFSTKAIISIVCAGVSVFFWPLGPLTGIGGLITGFMGMKESKQPGGTHRGWGLALAGTIISGLMFLVSLGLIALMGFAFFMAAEQQDRFHAQAQENRSRADMELIKERMNLYFIENNQSLAPGGPVVKDGWEGGLFPENHPKVQGELKLTDLVREIDLQGSLSDYRLSITSTKSAEITHTSSGAKLVISDFKSDRWRFEEGTTP